MVSCAALCPVSSAAVRLLSTLCKNTIRLDAGRRTSRQPRDYGIGQPLMTLHAIEMYEKNNGQFFVYGVSGDLFFAIWSLWHVTERLRIVITENCPKTVHGFPNICSSRYNISLHLLVQSKVESMKSFQPKICPLSPCVPAPAAVNFLLAGQEHCRYSDTMTSLQPSHTGYRVFIQIQGVKIDILTP